jgi:proteasome assembly chaperone (PAC2) family protein
MKITNVDLNLSELEKKAKEIEYIAHQLREMESLSKEKSSEDLGYFG